MRSFKSQPGIKLSNQLKGLWIDWTPKLSIISINMIFDNT